MPFGRTNYDMQTNFQSARNRIHELMDKHELCKFSKENYMKDLFNQEKYEANDGFGDEKLLVLKYATNHLTI